MHVPVANGVRVIIPLLNQLMTLRKKARAGNMFDVNIRAVIGFRETGGGYSAMKSFALCMNIRCLSSNSFSLINSKARTAYKHAATESMKLAASEIQSTNVVNGIPCARVSIDGSWQKRGHNSLHGLVTSMSGNKCIDTEILSKYCKGCKMWESRKGTPEYTCWKVDHNCEINHEKSSGAMESAGAVNIFKRSIANYNVMYNEYLGDGDTCSYNDVVNSEPYKDQGVIPIKLECVGHVQKRLGTRLRNLVKSHKGTKNHYLVKGN